MLIGHIYSNKTVFNWLYSFHMPLFFLAAGYTYKEKPILTDIKRRIQTIVVPYFSFGFLVLIYWQLLERRFRESNMGFADSFLGLLSGEYQYLDFNVHLWFLPCFFVTVVLFNILIHAGERVGASKKLAYIIAGAMSLVFVITDAYGATIPDMLWGFDRAFKYIGFYAIGCVLRDRAADDIIRKKAKSGTSRIIGITVLAVVLSALNFGLSYVGFTTGVMWFVTALVGVAAVGLVAIVIDHNRVLQYFGRISLVILCVHGPVYRVLVKLVSIPVKMSTDAVREYFILAMLVVVVTLAVCSVVYEAVMRIAPWMVGKKSKIVRTDN